MPLNIILIEDESTIETLYPFSVLHCPWEIRTGPMRFVDAWHTFLRPLSCEFHGREEHVNSFLARFQHYNSPQIATGMVVVLSSALVPTRAISEVITTFVENNHTGYILIDDILHGIICHQDQWNTYPKSMRELRHMRAVLHTTLMNPIPIESPILENIWDTLDLIDETIHDQIPIDIEPVNETDFRHAGVFAINTESIYVSSNCNIAPMVVLDATKGPIILGNNVTILSHASIIGPCYIGEGSIIKIGAKIYGHTVIGEYCKVGGEVENSIIHAYSSKQHDGFLGHSFLSEWVNLGADTNTSDLKNTYGAISVTLQSKKVNTSRMFLGFLCGDHTKTGINTMINTGTVCGIHCNIFGAGYTPTELSSFTWGGITEKRLYVHKMAMSVARIVMPRRNKALLAQEELLMLEEYSRVQSLF